MIAGYLGLFFAAFGAATLLPLQSEAVLAGLLLSGHYSLWLLLGIATLGNVLGSVVNWWLGRWVEHFKGRRWFPVSDQQLDKAASITSAGAIGHCCSVGCRSLATR